MCGLMGFIDRGEERTACPYESDAYASLMKGVITSRYNQECVFSF